MKYAVISDLHANESALRRVLADAKSHGADRVVCLGDIVGYGPLPAETLALARKSCVATVAGNHDDAVCGRHGDDTFTGLARDAVRRHREALQPADIAWLKSLPYTCEFGRAVAAHGDLFDPQKFYYVENESDAAATFDATDAQLVFVGHTHVPAIFLVGRSGNVYKTEPQDFTLEDGKRYIVNPGSVGYPRESGGKCFSSYVLYDTDENTVVFRQTPFAVSSVMQRGLNPRRISLAVLAAGAVALAAAAIVATRLLTGGSDASQATAAEESETGTRPAPRESAAKEAALQIALETVHLSPGDKLTTPGLKLGLRPKSCPVVLTTTYFDAAGRMLSTATETVKSSRTSLTAIPGAAKGAARAEFRLTRLSPEDEPVIVRFAPRAAASR